MHTVQILLQSCWRPKKHLLIHSGENPFKCRQCNYFCKQTGDLKKHILTHSGKKAFKCAQCNYSSRSTCSRIRVRKLSSAHNTPTRPLLLVTLGHTCFPILEKSPSVVPSAFVIAYAVLSSKPTCSLIQERSPLSVVSVIILAYNLTS